METNDLLIGHDLSLSSIRERERSLSVHPCQKCNKWAVGELFSKNDWQYHLHETALLNSSLEF